jgi:microsomal dipeptidase-like Zn-dependent dipeptidase
MRDGRRLVAPLILFLMALSHPARASVELHAHLFMKDAMNWMFSGRFDGPLRAHDYKSRFSSQANPDSVNRSGIRLLVAALYAHPILDRDMREAVRSQIEDAERFIARNPEWVLAKTSAQAAQALKSGKRVMVLSLEGAGGILETEEDFTEFVDRKGIRIVTPLHLTDDHYGGVAFLKGILSLANPLGVLRQIFHPLKDDGVRINDRGLTDDGRALIARMIEHHVWVDLAHASDRSAAEMIPMLEAAGQPILVTHTALRKYHQAERGISEAEIAAVAKTQGIVGLMPGEEMLSGTKVPENSTAPEGIDALAVQYRELAARIGAQSTAMGSDYNGGIHHLPPGGQTGTSLDQQGLWNIGQVPDLWKALEIKGAVAPGVADRSEENFVEAWARVDHAGEPTGPTR